MLDEEIAACVASVVGGPAEGAQVEQLGGTQGLLVCRVRLSAGDSFVFKAVRETRRRELALSWMLARLAPESVPRIVAFEEDHERNLYWVVMEDLGERRLVDEPNADGYVAAASALAAVQVACLADTDELASTGLPLLDAARWEDCALRLLDVAPKAAPDLFGYEMDLEQIVWATTDLACDASVVPSTIVHGDLHAGNVALTDRGVRLMDWGSAYLGAAFLGLEELQQPAVRHIAAAPDRNRVQAAYLRGWIDVLGKPGPLERAVLACRTLVRMEMLLDSLAPRRVLQQPDALAAAGLYRRLLQSWREWMSLRRAK